DGLVDEIYGSPALASRRVYFMTRYGTYCLSDPKAAVVAAPTAAGPRELKNSMLGAMGALTPAEVTLSAGQSVRFTRAGAGDGQVSWAVKGVPGVITRKWQAVEEDLTTPPTAPTTSGIGILETAEGGGFSAGSVTCSLAGVELAARVRVVPNVPFKLTFDDWQTGTVPPAWIGVGGGPNKKLVVTEHEGGKVLKKDTSKTRPSPPFMRLRTYFTPVLPVGYTVQCDMKSEKRNARRRSYMADMGLINARYRVIMLGADKQRGRKTKLRIESWSPVPRLRKDVEFDWEPDTWYTVRFEVKIAAEEALCRAKVWPRGDPEPAAWSIVVTDPFPNVEGSAGLYCYSAGTTSKSDGPATYFDNLKVYRDE
ncbi:MAG: hypothetical protein IH986_16730, partial [Planctomycetes bacterium]|nr:hypothetical protein [Planctomycetota bacterium]